jgi:YVTN family beta-propeller protein
MKNIKLNQNKKFLKSDNSNKKDLSPFVGPRPFDRDAEDQGRFFGRDDENNEIVSLIASHKLVLIYAQSGAGKTSLFNAKVIPTLENEGYEVLPITRVKQLSFSSLLYSERKDENHINNIYIFNSLQIIKDSLELKNFCTHDKSLSKKSLSNETLSQFLKEYCLIKKDKNNYYKRQILIFDQLEEIFDFFPNKWKEQREDFFNQIAIALEEIPPLQIVFIIREDYLAQLDPYSNFLPEKLRPRFRLEQLREDSAFLAVIKPLEKFSNGVNKDYVEEWNDDIKKIIKDLMILQVEYLPGKTFPIDGEFVEPIQLQVVFKRWWEKVIHSDGKSREQIKIDVTDVDNALEDFYENSLFKVIKQTRIPEHILRKWCEEKLITSSGTRSIVHRSSESTAGMQNEVIDILKSNYLIKENLLSGSRWYELIHDRLIKPIKTSNGKWIKEKEKQKRNKILKIAVPSAIVIIIFLISFNHWYNDQYIIEPVDSVPLGNLPFLLSVDQKSGLLYVTNPKSNIISIINGKRNDLIKEINVTDEPTDIAVDSNKNLIYISHPFAKKISVLQGSTNKIVKNISLNYSPFSIDLNSQNSKLYVMAYGYPVVSVIDFNNSANITDITVGNGPRGVAFDHSNNKIYVANNADNTVSVINGTTNKLLNETIKVGNGPTGIAVNSNNGKIYVINSKDNTLYAIDGTHYTVIKKIKVGTTPSSIGIYEKDNIVYVSNMKDDTISVINSTLDMVVATFKVGNRPTNVNINSNEHILYVVNNLDHNVLSLDMDKLLAHQNLSKQVLSFIPVGFHPSGLEIDNKNLLLYVANTDSNTVSVISGTSNLKIDELMVGEKPRDLDIQYKNDLVYVSNSLSDTVSVIDLKTKKIKTTINTNGKYPTGLSVNDETNLIYVANTDSDTVSVINGTTNKLLNETIKVGNGPTGIAVDQNNNLIYVTNYHNDSISVINGTSNLGSIPINDTYEGEGPISIAIDSDNNKMYVINFFSDNISIIDIDIIMKSLKENKKISINNYKYIITTINAGNSPNDISFNTNTKTLYVTNKDDNITKILDIPI